MSQLNNSVHMSLQGKGGVGKSLSMSFLMQYLEHKGLNPVGYDTDTENKTLSHYKALTVAPVDILDDQNKINERLFDLMLEDILKAEGVHVIDNGANSFRPMVSYMIDNEVIKVFQEIGSHLYMHTIISGGPDLNDTLASFKSLTEVVRASGATDNVSIVLWLNRHHGAVERDGVPVIEAPVIVGASDMIAGVVNLGVNSSVREDVEKMTRARLTFDEFTKSPGELLMSRRRICAERDRVFGELDRVTW